MSTPPRKPGRPPMNAEVASESVRARVTPDQLAEVHTAAAEEGVKVAEFVRRLLLAALRRRKRSQRPT